MVKLLQIRLVNCQSWKDGVIEFSKGLNVIRANNNTGKSVIFKMLKVTCNPESLDKADREDIIRRGSEYAEVTYLFDDSSAGIVRVYPHTVLFYFTPDARTIKLHQQENEPHEGLLNRLGIIKEEEEGYIANILDDDQPLLLVKSGSRANSNLMKVLTEHPQLSRLKESFKEKYSYYRKELTNVRQQKSRVEYKLNQIKYVNEETLEQDINNAEEFLEVMNSCTNILKTCFELSRNQVSDAPLNELDEISKALISLDDLSKNIKPDITHIDNDLVELATFFAGLNLDIKNEIPKEIVNSFLNIEDIFKLSSGLKPYKSDEIFNVFDDINNMNDILNSSYNLYNSVVKAEKVDTYIAELESIDFEGEEYDCALYGRIKYCDGKCVPL